MSRVLAHMVVAVFVSAAFAGCLSGGPSSSDGERVDDAAPVPRDIPLSALDRIEPFEVPARDETMLRGYVYIPKGDGPFATILNYSPYWNSIDGHSEDQAVDDGGRATMAGIFGPLMDAGFAIALINLRGTGESDGCKTWMDPEADGSDAYVVIEELAARPWSNGNVGMVGISWHGYSQYAALSEQPPSLKAVAPASTIIDVWSLFTRRGPSINTQFGPMASTWAAFHGVTAVGIYGDTPPDHVTCPEAAEQMAAFNQLTVDGDKTPFFQERELYEILENNQVPVFMTNGLGSGEGHILQIDGAWERFPPGSRMMVGQWGHSYPDDDKADVYVEMLIQWYDHHLRGGPETVEAGVVEWQDDTDQWHATHTWPPPANMTRFFLSDGALVASEDDVASSSVTFQSTYADPQPDECVGNKAVYVSPPLAQDVLLAGNFFANVTVAATEPNGHFGLHLWHLDDLWSCPDGLAATPGDDARPLEVSRALNDLRHRGGHFEQGRDFPIAQNDVMSMQSHPFASPVKAGERLVLGVAGGSTELEFRPDRPVLTVTTGGDVEGWIDIPVVEGQIVFAEGESWTRLPPTA